MLRIREASARGPQIGPADAAGGASEIEGGRSVVPVASGLDGFVFLFGRDRTRIAWHRARHAALTNALDEALWRTEVGPAARRHRQHVQPLVEELQDVLREIDGR